MTKQNEKGRFQSDVFRELKESIRELAEMGIDPSRKYSEDELARMEPLQADFLRKIKLSRENKYSPDGRSEVQREQLFQGGIVKKLKELVHELSDMGINTEELLEKMGVRKPTQIEVVEKLGRTPFDLGICLTSEHIEAAPIEMQRRQNPPQGEMVEKLLRELLDVFRVFSSKHGEDEPVKMQRWQKPARHRDVLPEELETCNKTAAPTDDQDDNVSEPGKPDDLVRLAVVVKECHVSRSTLKRLITQGKLKSYREKEGGTRPHFVSMREVCKLFPKK